MEKENQVEKENKLNQVSGTEDVVSLGKRMIKEKERKDQEKAAAEYSLAERLMRAVVCDVVEVQVKDDLGGFVVRCRRFSWSEQERFLEFAKEVNGLKAEDKKAVARANDVFFGLLAYPKGICLDAELDMAFWKKGDYGADLPRRILTAVRLQSEDSVAAAGSFRKK